MRSANPTIKTQEMILEVIRASSNPVSLTSISKNSNKSIYQVRISVEFLEGLGILEVIRSSKGMTLVKLKCKDDAAN